MKIYVTRHGQTALNAVDRVCGGATDAPLDETGIKQAEKLAEKIKDIDIDIIFSSPMQRAMQTAGAVAKVKNIEIITDNRLRERHYGRYENCLRSDAEYKIKKREFADRLTDGESLIDVAVRVYPFLDEIREKYSDKNVLIVAHASMMRVVNSYFVSLTEEEFFSFNMDNCELAEYEV